MVNLKLLVVQIAGLFVVIGLILFIAAGTVAWPAAWAFLIAFFVFTVAISIWLLSNNPGLLTERMKGNIQSEQKTWDKVLISITQVVFIAWLIVMPLDAVRFHWTQIPAWLQVVGGVMLLTSFYFFFVTFRENSFLSPVVRIQKERGQTVISTGPYHYVRHPMYSAALLYMVGTPLMLGSGYGVVVGLALILLIANRAVMEEQTLREELQGYDDYTRQVKYRLIPHVW